MWDTVLISALLASTLAGPPPLADAAPATEYAAATAESDETTRLIELVQQTLGPLYPLPVYQKCADPKFPWVHHDSMVGTLPDGVSFPPIYSEPLFGGMTAVYGLMSNLTLQERPVSVYLRCTSDIDQAQKTRLP